MGRAMKNKISKVSFNFSQVSDRLLRSLIVSAYKVQEKAYAPYSGFLIGSAILDSKDQIFTGCNVENSSYGGTVCAERVAIWKGISEKMKLPIKEIVVVSSEKDKWPPCGLCRQVMAEFCSPKTLVHFGNNKKEFLTMTFGDLLPEAFSNKFILK